MSVYRIGIYVDEDDDVYRYIDIKGSQKFIDLHQAISKSFGLGNKHSSFFISNKRWQKLNEITLGFKSVFETAIDGVETSIEAILPGQATNLIYFNEDAEEYSFLIQIEDIIDKEEKGKTYPVVVESKGRIDSDRNIFKEDFGVDMDDFSGLEGREGEDEDL